MGRHRAGDGVRAPWQEGAREALTAVGLDPGSVRDYAIRTVAEDLGPGWVDVTAAVTVPVEDERRASSWRPRTASSPACCSFRCCSPRRPRGWTCPCRPATCASSTDPGCAPATCWRTCAGVPVCCSRRSPARPRRCGTCPASPPVRPPVAGGPGGHRRRRARHHGDDARAAGARAVRRSVRRRRERPGRPLRRCVRHPGPRAGRRVLARALDAVRRRLPRAMVQVDVTTPLEAVEAVLAGARFVVCSGMDPDMLAGTVRQVRASTLEHVEIAAAGRFTLDDAKEFAQTGVDHLCLDDLAQRRGARFAWRWLRRAPGSAAAGSRSSRPREAERPEDQRAGLTAVEPSSPSYRARRPPPRAPAPPTGPRDRPATRSPARAPSTAPSRTSRRGRRPSRRPRR